MFDQEQAAIIAGTYFRNFALIRIPTMFSFWAGMPIRLLEGEHDCAEETLELPTAQADNTGSGRRRLLGTFVHEYYHYLHNVSTLAGVNDLVAQLRMARLFRETTDKSGTSAGSSALTPQKREEYDHLYEWISHLRGYSRLPVDTTLHRRDVQIRILRIREDNRTFAFQNPPVEGVRVTVELELISKSAAATTSEMAFGSTCLTEALAWEADHVIDNIDRETPAESAVDAIPYRVARAVLEHILGGAVDANTLMRTCLLALQSSDPGASFVEIARRLARGERQHRDVQDELEACAAITMRGLKDARDHIVKGMLYPELSAFENIKPMGDAFAFLKECCSEYIDLRCTKPFFELDFLSTDLNLESLVALLAEHPSCPVVQEGSSHEDGAFFVFGAQPPTHQMIVSLGAFQGFMDFFTAHLTAKEIKATSSIADRVCPFFSACRAPLALSNSEICRTRPWESFKDPPPPEGLCWYAGGVVGAMGRAPLVP